jgi:hypothetical protein
MKKYNIHYVLVKYLGFTIEQLREMSEYEMIILYKNIIKQIK